MVNELLNDGRLIVLLPGGRFFEHSIGFGDALLADNLGLRQPLGFGGIRLPLTN
jgi:hypothetical protein